MKGPSGGGKSTLAMILAGLRRPEAGLLFLQGHDGQSWGEAGWQLSHDERSRLYLARALLQDAGLTILDESFAALDPENMRQALRCALKRAKALLVIAHP